MLVKSFLTVLMVAAAMLAFSLPACGVVTAQTKPKQSQSVTYSCPMHPDFKSKKPGRCPKCGMTLRPDTPAPTPQPSASPAEPKTENYSFSSMQIPNVRVLDQNGKALNFYSDLVKGQNVAINFIFTTCTTVCPVLTATFRRVQTELEQSQSNVKLISISVDPTVDTPERLRDFAAKFKAGPGWTFVTGDKTEIDSLLQRLGAGGGHRKGHTPT